MQPKNDIKMYRRHRKGCPGYFLKLGKVYTFEEWSSAFPRETHPPTYYYGEEESTKIKRQKEKADCKFCPIWSRGYLIKETFVDENGNVHAKRNDGTSMGTTDWIIANGIRSKWYDRGSYEIRHSGTLIADAVQFFFQRQRALNALSPGSLDKYYYLTRLRMIPWCKEHGVKYIDAFEQRETCVAFALSWKRIRGSGKRKLGSELDRVTKWGYLKDLSAFLTFLVDSEPIRIAKNGTLKPDGTKDQLFGEPSLALKHGITEEEFKRLINVPPNPNADRLAPFEHEETITACWVIKICGLRPNDVETLNSSNIQLNNEGTGKLIDYIPHKTAKLKVPPHPRVPIPQKILKMLDALPGHNGLTKEGERVHYFFQSTTNMLLHHITRLGQRAQADGVHKDVDESENRFHFHFTPYSLRHTFFLQHKKNKTRLEIVSQMGGHSSTTTTEKYYGKWDQEMENIADAEMRTTNDKILAGYMDEPGVDNVIEIPQAATQLRRKAPSKKVKEAY